LRGAEKFVDVGEAEASAKVPLLYSDNLMEDTMMTGILIDNHETFPRDFGRTTRIFLTQQM